MSFGPCDTAATVAALKNCIAEKGLHYMDVGDLNNGRDCVFLSLKLGLVSRQGQHQRDVYRVLAMSYFYHRLN
jgi:hypothetical protein